VAWTSPAQWASSPSVHPLWEQKLYSVVSVPTGVILKTVPAHWRSATVRCPVEVPIGGLDQPRVGVWPSVPSKLSSLVKVCAEHPEGHVARKRAAGCHHLDRAGGRAGWNGGGDFGSSTTVKTAAVPLKLTLVAPVRLVPRILTDAPTLPEVVCVSTNGPRPTDRLKTVPSPCWPRPKRLSRRGPHWWPGPARRIRVCAVRAPLWEQKLYSVVSVPLGVI
jgi:hypothetical protein